jgi:hypothetical protein
VVASIWVRKQVNSSRGDEGSEFIEKLDLRKGASFRDLWQACLCATHSLSAKAVQYVRLAARRPGTGHAIGSEPCQKRA